MNLSESGHQSAIAGPVLQCRELCKRFGDVQAVDRLSLQINRGEVFGLLGPNGAGKSTAINMLCGLLTPDSGVIALHGHPINTNHPHIKKMIGVCPQEIIIWQKLTCLEQLQFCGDLYNIPSKTARQRSEALLQDLGLYEKKNKLAATLSGGMQRRLNILMALVHDPELIILDEPEAGLDPQSRVLVREYIRTLARQKTVLLTTHNMDEADRICDRVAIMDHGSILLVDSPDHLKIHNGAGQVLEIWLKETAATYGAIQALRKKWPDLQVLDHILLVRSHEIVQLIPEILTCLQKLAVPVQEIKLRENSLEDVFISLTGRRLRE